jgi:hypothetical protein
MHLGKVLAPLLLITSSAPAQTEFGAESRRTFCRVSHFEIMATLIELMGYGPARVRPNYGLSLSAVPTKRRRATCSAPSTIRQRSASMSIQSRPRNSAGLRLRKVGNDLTLVRTAYRSGQVNITPWRLRTGLVLGRMTSALVRARPGAARRDPSRHRDQT